MQKNQSVDDHLNTVHHTCARDSTGTPPHSSGATAVPCLARHRGCPVRSRRRSPPPGRAPAAPPLARHHGRLVRLCPLDVMLKVAAQKALAELEWGGWFEGAEREPERRYKREVAEISHRSEI